MQKQINPILFGCIIILCLFKQLVMASEVPRTPESANRWKIRGKTATAWFIGAGPEEKIFLTPIDGRIDTIFYQKMLTSDTSQWDYFLTRISVEGNYVGGVGTCCYDFHIYPSEGRPSGTMEVQFRLTSTDNKLYLGRFGNNGVILNENEIISLNDPCHNYMGGNRINHPCISIEEIDTSKAVLQALFAKEEAAFMQSFIDGEIYGRHNAGINTVPELRELVCINSVWPDSSGYDNYSYCSKRTIVGFSFIPLDKKPLIVEFDAKTQKVFLR